ncbi:dihydroorotase [Actinomarinicola tropica]|uniref:Dihydroorotase n=1 Tax=Actinomarinicola tropica TaxID=2789776 RepID=A0A5Q2RM62_9ACTN|nr:dihydroorotase [Actinomarinicola tropica]QGG95177.1 amidohydrolase family protein [Actinomarinicola tropica]
MADPTVAPLLVAGGTVLDADGSRRADVRIGGDGRIAEVGPDLDADGAQVLDATGCLVAPGLVDLHTHLRQPGKEEAETIETGSRCAALGGYTAVVAMPNTTPTMDSAAVIREVQELGRAALCAVVPSGAITVGRAGEQLSPMAELAELGVTIFTDDGTGVQDDRLMRRALEYASGLGVTLAQHCEVTSLSEGSCMHEGEWSSRLGLPGQPAEAEELMVMRDIALARLTGARVHLQHLSTAGSVALVRAAKAEGLPVTAEATTHHFTLTDACVASYDPVFKVHPPLRTDADVAAVRSGLADGTIDAIATDHAPHTTEEKERPFDAAPPGMLGLETALALALTELTGPDADPRLDVAEVLALLSWRPAAIAGIDDRHGGPVVPGRPANLCVVDADATWTVDRERTASRSRNTPYAGRTLRGRVRHTIYEGTPTVIDGDATR